MTGCGMGTVLIIGPTLPQYIISTVRPLCASQSQTSLFRSPSPTKSKQKKRFCCLFVIAVYIAATIGEYSYKVYFTHVVALFSLGSVGASQDRRHLFLLGEGVSIWLCIGPQYQHHVMGPPQIRVTWASWDPSQSLFLFVMYYTYVYMHIYVASLARSLDA